MKETLVKLLLKLLAGISADQWRKALEYVSNAAQTAMGSAEKKSWVVESLRAMYPKLSEWAINYLVESAVGIFKSKQ
jgi:hypothetical protein